MKSSVLLFLILNRIATMRSSQEASGPPQEREFREEGFFDIAGVNCVNLAQAQAGAHASPRSAGPKAWGSSSDRRWVAISSPSAPPQ